MSSGIEKFEHSEDQPAVIHVGRIGEYRGGLRIIARGSRIAGGVYYGTYFHEPIVVDLGKNHEQYEKYYNDVVAQVVKSSNTCEQTILESVYNTIKTNMPHSKQATDELLCDMAESVGKKQLTDTDGVELGTFMKAGFGASRHQALAAAMLLEMLRDNDYIQGSDISIDVNESKESQHDDVEDLAWVRYTSVSGKVTILDLAGGYFGDIEDSYKNTCHDYYRHEDRCRIRKLGRGYLDGI